MKFIEIMGGLSVNLDAITLIQQISDNETRIQVGDEIYVTNVPYEVFRKVLSRQMKGQQSITDALEQLAKYQGTHTP